MTGVYIPQAVVLNFVREDHVRPGLYMEHWLQLYLDEDFYMHFRMYKNTFQHLLQAIGSVMNQRNVNVGGREDIPLDKRILMTLWYLAKGDNIHSSIADRFNVTLSSVNRSVTVILESINMLTNTYIRWPTAVECRRVAEDFQNYGGYPSKTKYLFLIKVTHCAFLDVIGAIDGTHIPLKVPEEQQDSYLDRKFQHSIIVQGICTKKIYTNLFVGFPGCAHDARVSNYTQDKYNF